jgi:Mrp family chromosome partitioning ATPase
MSTLDRAFIRAYQKQRVIPAPHVAFPAKDADALTATAPDAPRMSLPPMPAVDLPPRAEMAVAPPLAPEAMPKAAQQNPPLQAALEVVQFDWPETAEGLRLSSADYFDAWSRQFAADRNVTWMVASNARGEGRTTVLLAAAHHLALLAREAKIVLVDADFKHPQLAMRLGVALEVGWEDVFSGEQPLSEALVESSADHVTLLALRQAVPEEQILAGGARLMATLRSLQQNFDFVCIDAGPFAELAEAAQGVLFGREMGIDAALVVRDVRAASGEENSVTGRRLAQFGIGHWDLVENYV